MPFSSKRSLPPRGDSTSTMQLAGAGRGRQQFHEGRWRDRCMLLPRWLRLTGVLSQPLSQAVRIQPQAAANKIDTAPLGHLRRRMPQLFREVGPWWMLATKLRKAFSQFFQIVISAAVGFSHPGFRPPAFSRPYQFSTPQVTHVCRKLTFDDKDSVRWCNRFHPIPARICG